MAYRVKELFFTLQGEGFHTGRAAVFCRFSGCNLWTGREEDRARAVCRFCDTDFRGIDGPGGGEYESPEELASAVVTLWNSNTEDQSKRPFLVCTGGEPLLQLDSKLISALHELNVYIAIESNGTKSVPDGIDWICISPKEGADWLQRSGDELKLVYPQRDLLPDSLPETDFRQYYLQPMDGPELRVNMAKAVEYCRRHPRWKLSLQTHKILNIP